MRERHRWWNNYFPGAILKLPLVIYEADDMLTAQLLVAFSMNTYVTAFQEQIVSGHLKAETKLVCSDLMIKRPLSDQILVHTRCLAPLLSSDSPLLSDPAYD